MTTITVVGSANMDLVVTVPTIPRLGETVTGTASLRVPGGKGVNQALASARAGATVRMVGAVGDDSFGTEIRDLLAANGVDTSGLLTMDGPTGTAHIMVEESGENVIVVVPGANGKVASVNDEGRRAIALADLLLMQLELPLSAVTAAADWASQHDTAVVLTPAPVMDLPQSLMANVDLLIANQPEGLRLTGHRDPVIAARALLALGVGAVVITLGADGCVYVDPKSAIDVAAPSIRAVDATGAGDTFAGCLAVALGEGREVKQALEWATAAAALSVQHQGASSSMPKRTAIDAAAARLD